MAGDCAPGDCPVQGGFLLYQPSRPGNAVLLGMFSLLVPITLIFGYRLKTPIYASALTTGLLLEILGFIGRILLHSNVASRCYFVLFLLGTILGPTFIATSLFLVLPHAISVYGPRASSFQPKRIGVTFATLSFTAAALEVVGVVFAAFSVIDIGESANILAAGLGVQGTALILFLCTHFWLAVGISGEREKLDPKHARTYRSARFKRFLLAMQVVTVFLLGHTIYRVIETASGFNATLFQHETAFMLANGVVPLLACLFLTAFPPGAAFGQAWGPTSPRYRNKHNLDPLPLHSPRTPYDRFREKRSHEASPRGTGGEKSQQSPTSDWVMPLRESTMATAVRQNPSTRTNTQQPTPIATTQRYSPTFWREQYQQQKQQQQQQPQHYELHHQSKTSPTFPNTMTSQSPKQSPTFQPGHQSSSIGVATSTPQEQPVPSHKRGASQLSQSNKLVDSDTLW